MFLDSIPRFIAVTGHYGAGKTNIAVNLALSLKNTGRKVTLVDLDIVNPYFRAADSRLNLENAGIGTIIPEYANTNVDMPTLPAEINSLFMPQNADTHAILDVGGDDSGATALAGFSSRISAAGYQMLYVINMYRPMVADPKDAVELMRDIEYNSRLKCTAIVNNSNLGVETTLETVRDSFEYANEVSRLSGLPIAFTSALDSLNCEGTFGIKNMTRKMF